PTLAATFPNRSEEFDERRSNHADLDPACALHRRRDAAAVDAPVGDRRSHRPRRGPPIPSADPAADHCAAVRVPAHSGTAVDWAGDDGAAVPATDLLHNRAHVRLPPPPPRQARTRPGTGRCARAPETRRGTRCLRTTPRALKRCRRLLARSRAELAVGSSP